LSSINVTITITVTSSISFANSTRYCAQIMDQGAEIHLVFQLMHELRLHMAIQLLGYH